MPGKLIQKPLLLALAAVTIVLVITVAATLAFSAVLGAMGDDAGRTVLGWVAAGVGVVLAVDLMCLVLALALHAVERPDDAADEGESPR